MYSMDLESLVRAGKLDEVRNFLNVFTSLPTIKIVCLAIERDNSAILELLLRHGALTGELNAARRSYPLFKACERNNLQCVEILLSAGVDINAQDDAGFTPINFAVALGRENVVDSDKKHDFIPLIKLLLAKGANVNKPQFNGLTPLALAVENNFVEAVEILLAAKANVNAGNKGHSPLHSAIRGGRIGMVKLLLDHGAKIDIRDDQDRTPLGRAVDERRPDIVRLILDRRPDLNDIYDQKALRLPILGNSLKFREIIRELLRHGFRYRGKPSHWRGVFNEALQNNNYEVVRRFLKIGYNFNENSKGEDLSPLHLAIQFRSSTKMMKLILDHGADINRDSELGTLITMAIEKSDSRVLQLLLRYQSTRNDPHLLVSAIYKGDLKVIETLLENGSDVNALVKLKSPRQTATAIHAAVLTGSVDVVKTLLLYGADPNFKASASGTPLNLAIRKKDRPIFQTLLSFGASLIGNKSSLTELERCAYFRMAFLDYHFKQLSELEIKDLKHVVKSMFGRESRVTSHCLKMKAAGFLLTEEWLDRRLQATWASNALRQCNKEIENMKKEKFEDSDVSIYDLLIANDKQFAWFSRNPVILKGLSDFGQLKNKFPLYSKYILVQIQSKRRLRNEYIMSICTLAHSRPNLLKQLLVPIEIIEKILNYLSVQNLKNVMNVFAF